MALGACADLGYGLTVAEAGRPGIGDGVKPCGKQELRTKQSSSHSEKCNMHELCGPCVACWCDEQLETCRDLRTLTVPGADVAV